MEEDIYVSFYNVVTLSKLYYLYTYINKNYSLNEKRL